MTRTTTLRTYWLLAITAVAVVGVIANGAAAVAMPLQIGITEDGSGTVVTAEAIATPDVSASACRSDECILPVRTLTDARLHRLHLIAAGPLQIGFVTVIDGQTVVADGVDMPGATDNQWHGGNGRIGFIEH